MQDKSHSFVSMNDVLHPARGEAQINQAFPDAPDGWNQDHAQQLARKEGLELTDAHWEVVRALQGFYVKMEDRRINTRDLHDALDEKFHRQGGIRFLYQILPGGPIAQGCRLAGLLAPAGSVDSGFGSVV